MEIVYSSGVLINSCGKVLLCHATNGKNTPRVNDNRWGIPKGIIDAGETPEQTAIREVFEETGLDISNEELIKISELKYPSSMNGKRVFKILSVFKLIGDSDLVLKDLNCTSMIPETPDLPEVDECIWVSPSVAQKICYPSQIVLFL